MIRNATSRLCVCWEVRAILRGGRNVRLHVVDDECAPQCAFHVSHFPSLERTVNLVLVLRVYQSGYCNGILSCAFQQTMTVVQIVYACWGRGGRNKFRWWGRGRIAAGSGGVVTRNTSAWSKDEWTACGFLSVRTVLAARRRMLPRTEARTHTHRTLGHKSALVYGLQRLLFHETAGRCRLIP